MIFKLDNTIITYQQNRLYIFAHALQHAQERLHYVVMEQPVRTWIESNILSNTTYLSEWDIESIKKDQFFMQPSALESRTLQTVIVGNGINMLTIEQMLDVVDEPGVVVLENGLNDWSVLRRWTNLMSQRRCPNKTINESVLNAMNTALLRNENAGGGFGTIKNRIISIEPNYKGLHALRVTTVFDSDKMSALDMVDHNASLKQFLTAEKMEWHELSRREMENYFPIEAYQRAGLMAQGLVLPASIVGNWAYEDIESVKGINYVKNDLPLLTSNLSNQDIDALGANVLDEIQSVILHLAKYI